MKDLIKIIVTCLTAIFGFLSYGIAKEIPILKAELQESQHQQHKIMEQMVRTRNVTPKEPRFVAQTLQKLITRINILEHNFGVQITTNIPNYAPKTNIENYMVESDMLGVEYIPIDIIVNHIANDNDKSMLLNHFFIIEKKTDLEINMFEVSPSSLKLQTKLYGV